MGEGTKVQLPAGKECCLNCLIISKKAELETEKAN